MYTKNTEETAHECQASPRSRARPARQGTRTAHRGIIVPDTAKEKPQRAKVVAIGGGRVNDDGETIPLDVKVGEYVLIGKYAGTEITLDGEDYLIVREDD